MKDKKSIGYYAGTAFGIVVTLCMSAIVVAMTAKVVMWIL